MYIELTAELISVSIVVAGLFARMYLDHIRVSDLIVNINKISVKIDTLERQELTFSKDLKLSYVSLKYLQEKYSDTNTMDKKFEHFEVLFKNEVGHITEKLNHILKFIEHEEEHKK